MTHPVHDSDDIRWYAIKTWHDFQAEEYFKAICPEVFFPKRTVVDRREKIKERAFIPHLLFVRMQSKRLLELEQLSKDILAFPFRFWIYRYPCEDRPEAIPDQNIRLLRLLVSDSGEGCEIFRHEEMAKGTKVRVIGGKYKGYEGVVRRVNRKRHVLVRIVGECVVMLPHIHPELLQVIQ